MNQPREIIRQAGHELLRELFDEIALPDPNVLQPQINRWLTAFSGLQLGTGVRGHHLLMLARMEAAAYYDRHFWLKHHTTQDMTWFTFQLSRALLMACNRFQPAAPEVFLHTGHYANLYQAVWRMTWEMGTLERRYNTTSEVFFKPYTITSLNLPSLN